MARKKEYDYDKIQKYYDEGHSLRECAKEFGITIQTLNYAANQGWFVARDQKSAMNLKATQNAQKKQENLSMDTPPDDDSTYSDIFEID